SKENRWNRLEDNRRIQQRRPLLGIVNIEQAHLIEGNITAPAGLPEARQPWRHIQTLAVPILVLRYLTRQRRARANETHLAAQDIEELRQLIKAQLANHPSDPCHTRVVLDLEERPIGFIQLLEAGQFLLGPYAHRAELKKGEEYPIAPHPRLLEQH